MTSIHKNSSSVLISSNKPLQEIESLFRKNFPDREVVINDKISINFDDNSDKNNNNIITLTNMNNLHRDIADKDTKIIDMEVNALKTTEAINAFYRQQQALFDEFVILRKKYDDLKNTMHKTLWNHCLPYHPDFRHIPPLDSNLTEDEEKGLYGNYTTAELIGEGQFATVRACTRPTHLSVHSGNQTRGRSLSHSSLSRRPSGEPTTLPSTSLSAKSKATPPILTTKEVDGNTSIQDPMAIKLIKKSKITSIHFMHRLASEVDTLHRLRDSEHVIRLLDSFQTPSHVCLVTERGGKDLFELLRAHTEGLPEAWVRSISVELIRGVTFCHRNGICHRGLYEIFDLIIFFIL